MENSVPCPPAPKFGYTQSFDHEIKKWILTKNEIKPVRCPLFPKLNI